MYQVPLSFVLRSGTSGTLSDLLRRVSVLGLTCCCIFIALLCETQPSMTGAVGPVNPNSTITNNNTSTEAGQTNSSNVQGVGLSPPPPANNNTARLSPQNQAPPPPSPLSPSPPPPSPDQNNTKPDQGALTHVKGGKCELGPVIGSAVPSSEDSKSFR